MKKWTQLAVIATAVLTLTAAPALAGPRHGHGVGWKPSHHGTRSFHGAGGPRYYYPPVYRPSVGRIPVFVPAHRHHGPHRHVPTWQGIHGRGAGYHGGVNVHSSGFGIHIRF